MVNFELKRVDVWSLVKIVFFLYAIIGLLVGLFYILITLIFTLVGGMAGFIGGENAFPMIGLFSGIAGFFMAFVFAIFYAVFGSIFTAISAGLYNLLAKWLGGLRLSLTEEIHPEEAHPIEPPSQEESA